MCDSSLKVHYYIEDLSAILTAVIQQGVPR
jgi:hypothetical protein